MSEKQELAQQRLKERQAKKRFKLVEGDTTFRVLPNAKGADRAEYTEYAMHGQIGPRKAYMRCGIGANGKGDCFLCNVMIPKLEAGKSASRASAEAMARKEVFAVQIAYKEGKKWLGPTLWEMPSGVANTLLGIMGRRDISDPKKGYNLTISRTGTGMRDTKYTNLERDDEPSPVDKDILAKIKPFSELIRKYNEDEMKAAYYGHEQDAVDEDEDEEGEEKEKDEDEDTEKEEESEDESEKDESEEDEDEVKPKGGKKKPKDEDEDEEVASGLDEDEDEEDDADVPDLDEEDEDEKPKGGKKPKVEEDDEETESEADDDGDDDGDKKPPKKKDKDKAKASKKSSEDDDD